MSPPVGVVESEQTPDSFFRENHIVLPDTTGNGIVPAVIVWLVLGVLATWLKQNKYF